MPETQRPNVLVILVDQLNPLFGGWAGDPTGVTPNLDRLAAEGTVFDCAYSVGPVCMPGRCSFISGLYPHQHGYWTNFIDEAFPARLGGFYRDVQAAGYHTAYVGKTHWFNPAWGEHTREHKGYFQAIGLDTTVDIPGTYLAAFQGSPYTDHLRSHGLLDTFLRDMALQMQAGQYAIVPSLTPADFQPDAVAAQEAIKIIEGHTDEEPLCLTVSFPGPHPPFNAPGDYATMVDPADVVLPETVPAELTFGGRTFTRDDVRALRANYHGKLALIDDWCGRILAACERCWDMDNTLVVFTSDHGEMLGAHGRFSKCQFWEESARIPLFVRWPSRVAAGQRTRALAELIDVYPTVVEAVGGRVSPWCCGRSLLPVATGAATAHREIAVSEFWSGSGDPSYMIRGADHKYFRQGTHEHLYDLDADPGEQRNLIESAPSIAEDLRQRLALFLNHSSGYRPLFDRANLQADSPDLARDLLGLFRGLHHTTGPDVAEPPE